MQSTTHLYLFTKGHSHILTLYLPNDGSQHQTDNLLRRPGQPMVLLKHVCTLYQGQTFLSLSHRYIPTSVPEVLVWTTLPNNRTLIKSAENLQQLKTKYLNIVFPWCFVDKGLEERAKRKGIISSLYLHNDNNKCYSSTLALLYVMALTTEE